MHQSNEISNNPNPVVYTAKDFETDQEVRWCPGCGDYAVLNAVKKVLPQLLKPKEDIVFVSGIGCSSRFPYYIDTYGMHSIHGRAFAIATGLKLTRPELDVWVITGDGDGLSIGGNHLIHLFRRNPNLNVLLFNNEIYGLTKGQHSPTSKVGQVVKSAPLGVIDDPFHPPALLLGAGAGFVARTADRFPAHMQEVLLQANQYVGSSFVEIYQNCNIFNDGAFEEFTSKESKEEHALFLKPNLPLFFGKNEEKALVLNGFEPQIVSKSEVNSSNEWIHDPHDFVKATILANLSRNPIFPRPFGVFYAKERVTYEALFNSQKSEKSNDDLNQVLEGKFNWVMQ
jgi:2-oxoglutarate ferredoxin oxidoreductase subunit beta